MSDKTAKLRFSVRLPADVARQLNEAAAERGLSSASCAALLIERALLRGAAADIGERLRALETAVATATQEQKTALRKVVDYAAQLAGALKK